MKGGRGPAWLPIPLGSRRAPGGGESAVGRSRRADASCRVMTTRWRAATIYDQKRLSVSFLMMVVLVVAVDFAVFRYLDHLQAPRNAAIVSLPMISLLVLTAPCVRRGPFWVGFQAVGWITTFVLGSLAWADVYWLHLPLIWTQRLLPRFEVEVNRLGDPLASVIFLSYDTGLYTTPQILLALLGGWVAASRGRGRAGPAVDELAS